MSIVSTSAEWAHPRFDYETARKVFAAEASDCELRGELVTCPFDVYAIETLRDQLGLRIGQAVPTDVFVFGKGEPENPAGTKLGGRPFWPAGRPWPQTPDGRPCAFLAQFNFADSLDLVGDNLPGTILSILVDDPENWPSDTSRKTFVWLSHEQEPDRELQVPSALGPAGPFFGAIHRTFDYPEADDLLWEWEEAGRTTPRYSYLLPNTSGTKIGGVPFFIQGGEGLEETFFLCQLASIQAEPDVPYPWVNQREPLTLLSHDPRQIWGGPGSIHNEQNCVSFHDMGSLYLMLDFDGKLTSDFQSF